MATLSVRVAEEYDLDGNLSWNYFFIGVGGVILWRGEGGFSTDFAAAKVAWRVRRRFVENQRLVDHCRF